MTFSIFLPRYLSAISKDGWTPGIGDPSLMGWVTVIAYFSAAVLSIFCAIFVSHSIPLSSRARIRFFWWCISGILIFLGINKQLDLQSWLTFTGRVLSRDWGWYEHRRDVQKLFILMLTGSGIFLFYRFTSRFRQVWEKNKLACLGLVFLAFFVIGRAASFHHMDHLINLRILGLRMNWILELGGICLIIISCFFNIRKSVVEFFQKDSRACLKRVRRSD